MSKEDVQKKASAAEAVLTLEAVSTVKGLVGPAVKPKKRAAAKETSSSAKRSGESEKTAPKAKRRTSSASKRPRRQGIRADALIRARDRQAQESSLQEGAQRLKRLTMRIRCRYLKRMQTRRLRARGPLNCLICL